MQNRWTDIDEQNYASRHSNHYTRAIESDILQQAYATTLLGADNDLTMHGGGNTSVKNTLVDDTGKSRRALFVKATGTPLKLFTPDYFVAMDLDFLESLKGINGIDDEAMAREFRLHQIVRGDRLPSIESLMHAFIPAKFVAHTHPAAILKIVNRIGGRELLRECFGGDLAYIPYTRMGFDLAKASSEAARTHAGCSGVVVGHHGLVTWGGDARVVYDTAIDIITKAEDFLAKIIVRPIAPPETEVSAELSIRNYERISPVIKKCLSQILQTLGDVDGKGCPSQGSDHLLSINADCPVDKISLALLNTPDALELINSPDGRDIIDRPPMTPDYPMLQRILPVWLEADINASPEKVLRSVNDTISKYIIDYRRYLENHGIANIAPADLLPKAIIHPSVGVVCVGHSEDSALMTADFTRQAFAIRRAVAETGGAYESLPEEHLFDMQYRGYQKGKR